MNLAFSFFVSRFCLTLYRNPTIISPLKPELTSRLDAILKE
jgi:hypothetical protein